MTFLKDTFFSGTDNLSDLHKTLLEDENNIRLDCGDGWPAKENSQILMKVRRRVRVIRVFIVEGYRLQVGDQPMTHRYQGARNINTWYQLRERHILDMLKNPSIDDISPVSIFYGRLEGDSAD